MLKSKSIVKSFLRSMFRKFNIIFRKKYEGQTLYYDPSTDIGWMLLIGNDFEREEIRICKDLIQDNSVVIDIGANIGCHTIAFAKKAINGLVMAIEASPKTFCQLLRNIDGLSNVLCMNVALSSKCGMSDFYVTSDNAYSGLKNTGRKSLLHSIKVPCYSGTHLIQPILPDVVDFIKIDVEGLETEVIVGMQDIIQKDRPIVFCEIYAGKASNPDVLLTIKIMEDMKYIAYILDGAILKKYVEHSDRHYNYFFFPAEKMEQYAAVLKEKLHA